MVFLVRDWKIYRDRLLMPQDFAENAPLTNLVQYLDEYDEAYLQPGTKSYNRHEAVAQRYDGTTRINPNEKAHVFHSEVLLSDRKTEIAQK